MYDEDSYRSEIFWIKAKRTFLIILFAIIGCSLGVLISQYFVDVLLFKLSKSLIIIFTTLIFISMALLLTANTGRDIQDGYWKIAVLRKLTLISKKLDALENLDKLNYLEGLSLNNKGTKTEKEHKNRVRN